MSSNRLRTRIAASLVLIALTGLSFVAPAAAQKGGGTTPPAPAPGTIYFNRTDDGRWSMKGDGTGQARSVAGEPSYQSHGGSRWFLRHRFIGYDWRGVDADGNDIVWPIWDLYAADEDGVEVWLMTNPADIGDSRNATWSRDDSFVSFSAPAVVEGQPTGGVFVVNIDWSSGEPVAARPLLVQQIDFPASYFDYPWWHLDFMWWDVIYGHDWSPAGDQLAYLGHDAQGARRLFVSTFSDEGVEVRQVPFNQNGNVFTKPVWSPDGTRLAAKGLDGIWTLLPDGTGAVRLTQTAVTSKERREQYAPTWSPDGAYVAYTEERMQGSKPTYSYDVLRIPSGGGTPANLTRDGASAGPVWRP